MNVVSLGFGSASLHRFSSRLGKLLLVALVFFLAPAFAGDFTEATTNSYATRPGGNPGAVPFLADLQYRTRSGGLAVVEAVGRSGDAFWRNFGTVLNPDWRLKTQTFLRPQYVDSYIIGQNLTLSGFQTWLTLGADPTTLGTLSGMQQYFANNPIGGSHSGKPCLPNPGHHR